MAEKPAVRTVVIPMIVPSHKNQLRPSKHGGMYLDMKARKEREALMLYLKAGLEPIGEEWACRLEMEIDLSERTTTVTLVPTEIYDHKKCPDADGMASALMDSAQHCGILVNDNRVKELIVRIK